MGVWVVSELGVGILLRKHKSEAGQSFIISEVEGVCLGVGLSGCQH